MKKLYLVHGIRAADKGTKSMGGLRRKLMEKFSFVKQVSYGYVLIPITNKKAVRAIINSIENVDNHDEVIVVAYSNGCWAAVQAAEMGYKIDHLVLISPALHKSHAIPEHVKRVDVYYCPGDNIVELGGIYRRLINLLPWNWSIFGDPHDWGAMGKYGYVGNDLRIHNWKMPRDTSHFWYKYKYIVNGISSQIVTIHEKGV